jgi:RNA polymerase sigma-70 factor (ECF subfamily)
VSDGPVPRPDAASLLEHARFVRAVAGAVLRGDAQVDDVVQDTWIAALGHAPRTGGALRGWLARIARNRSLQVLRTGRRRARREERASRPEATPSVQEIAEREDTRRRLVQALLTEPEPYRTALVMRYYEDLPPREIARRLDVPVETVKTRVKRGLDHLRARMDEASDRPEWHRALAPLAGVAGTFAGPKVAAAVAVAVVLGVAAWVVATPTARREEDASRPTAAVLGEVATAVPVLVGAAPARAEPEERPPLPGWAGLVVDDVGSPVTGARIVSLPGTGVSLILTKTAEPEPDLARLDVVATTDAAGRFALRRALLRGDVLAFFADGHEVVEEPAPPSPWVDVRFVLPRGRKVTGRVTDGEGHAIVGATVHGSGISRGRMIGHRTTTDAEGSFQLRYLPSRLRLSVDADGYVGESLDEGEPPEPITFRLQRDRLLVTAVAAETGERLTDAAAFVVNAAGPYVAALSPRRKKATPDGDLALDVYLPPETPNPDGLAALVHVVAPGRRAVRVPATLVPDAEPPHVRVELVQGEEPPTVAGRVVGAASARVELRTGQPSTASAPWPDDQLVLLATADTAADGAFAFRGFPEGRYRVTVHGDGRLASRSVDVTTPALDVVVALEVGGTLRVRARTPAGTPAAHAWIHVQQDEGPLYHSAQTAPDGTVGFMSLPAGPLSVAPRGSRSHGRVARWSATASRVAVATGPGETRTVDVVVPERTRFEIVLRDAGGRGLDGAEIRLEADLDGHAASVEGEWDRVRALRLTTGGDGRVATELFAGPYQVTVDHADARRTAWAHVPLTPGGSLEVVVPRAVVRGRAVDAATGAPIGGRAVLVREAAREDAGVVWGATDATGAFEVVGVPDGPLHVEVVTGQTRGRASFEGNPYAGGYVEVDAGATATIRLPRAAGEGAVEPSVDVELAVTDAATGGAVQGASMRVYGLRDGTWVRSPDGPRVLGAQEYRVTLYNPPGTRPPYARRDVVVRPRNGVLRVEVALSR